MKTLMQRCRLAIAGLLLAAVPMVALQAQEEAANPMAPKPVAVLSIAPVEKLLGDIQYLADAAQQSDFGRMAAIMTAPFTQGIDKTRPIGAVVMTDGQQFSPLVFLPVADLDSLLLIVKEQFGPPQDVGGDVKLLPTPLPVFIKKAGDWAFISMDKDKLATTPEDPAALLGELPQQYDLAIKGYMQNVPEIYRDTFVEQIKSGVELSLEQEPNESDAEFTERKAQINKQLQDINRLFTELEDLTIGWNIDASQKGTYLDIKYTAVAGSTFDKTLQMNLQLTSEYAGFIKEGAAANLQVTQKIPEEEIERMTTQFRDLREQGIKQLEKDGELEGEELESAKKVIDLMIDTLVETVRTGKLDGAANLDLTDGKATFLAGTHVADGSRVEDGLKELAKMAEGEEDFPGVQWDADTHQTIRFHVMDLPMDDAPAEAKQAFGENPTVVVGIGERSVYFGFGHDALARLKQGIDASIGAADQPVTMMEMDIALLPILKMAQKYSKEEATPGLAAAIDALSGGNDHILMTSAIDGQEVRVRLLIQEGVIKSIGAGAAAQNAQADAEIEAEF